MQYGDEYAHYPYPDEYLNERNQQFLANNVVDAYGRPAHQMQQHPQQRLESDCKFHSMHALLTLYFLQYSTFFINLHPLSVMLHHQNWRINLNVLFFPDSPYGDVSGLPDPYGNGGHGGYMEEPQTPTMATMQQQNVHMSFDQDAVDGANGTTPNSRSRRIIREIIVWSEMH